MPVEQCSDPIAVTDRGSDAAKKKGNLYGQLAQMSQDGALTNDLADWAKQIRTLGNAGAHPDHLETVTTAEASDLSRLTNSLLEYLYRVPARLQRSRNAR